MEHLPLFLNIRDKNCLVVGGGGVASRKVELLLQAGARITIIAIDINDGLKEISRQNSITYEERAFQPTDIDNCFLVIAGTTDHKLNRHIFELCSAQDILINTVDQPELCSAIFPSVIDRSPVLIGVSTGGTSPTLARIVRRWIETSLPLRLGVVANYLQKKRNIVKNNIQEFSSRQRFWDSLLNSVFLERLLRDDTFQAEEDFETLLRVFKEKQSSRGEVYLVGAGPGDPELLTIKAVRLMGSADVIFYDNLVNKQILDFARRDAEKIYVGKKKKFPGIRQEAINELLVKAARSGRKVVRLKGGDPLIFGRGGEEAEILFKEEIPFVIVPGITAASGTAGYAGIPLTHRDVSQSVRFITGHRVYDHVNLDWPELAKPDQTLVIYMGFAWLKEIMEELEKNGLSPETPAALIEKATMPEQKVVIGVISDLAKQAELCGIKGPTTIIVGEVVRYRTQTG